MIFYFNPWQLDMDVGYGLRKEFWNRGIGGMLDRGGRDRV